MVRFCRAPAAWGSVPAKNCADGFRIVRKDRGLDAQGPGAVSQPLQRVVQREGRQDACVARAVEFERDPVRDGDQPRELGMDVAVVDGFGLHVTHGQSPFSEARGGRRHSSPVP